MISMGSEQGCQVCMIELAKWSFKNSPKQSSDYIPNIKTQNMSFPYLKHIF